MQGEADKEWYGDISAVTFVLKELLTISPQLCDSTSSIAWKAFLLRLATWRSSCSSLQSVGSSLQSVGMCLQPNTCFAGCIQLMMFFGISMAVHSRAVALNNWDIGASSCNLLCHAGCGIGSDSRVCSARSPAIHPPCRLHAMAPPLRLFIGMFNVDNADNPKEVKNLSEVATTSIAGLERVPNPTLELMRRWLQIELQDLRNADLLAPLVRQQSAEQCSSAIAVKPCCNPVLQHPYTPIPASPGPAGSAGAALVRSRSKKSFMTAAGLLV